VNGAQDQERDGGGACQAMDDTYEQRAQGVEKAEVLDGITKPIRDRKRIAMVFSGGGVRMPVVVDVGVVLMDVGVFTGNRGMRGREFFAEPFGDAGKI
jgi:hypothetical protein